MFWFELVSCILFVILMTVGYRENKRNWMLMISYPSLVYWYLNSERMRLGGIE